MSEEDIKTPAKPAEPAEDSQEPKTQEPQEKRFYSSCQICKRPLGQESKDLGYQLCHNCRKCTTCGTETTPTESNYCIANNWPINHARCIKLPQGETLQHQIDLANISRLLTEATLQIQNMSFDEKYVFLRMLQDTAANVSLLINRDKKSLNHQLNQERQTKQEKAAASKKAEVAISGKTERKHLTEAAKAINALTKNGVLYSAACKSIYNTEIQVKKRTSEQARLTVLEAMISLGTPKEDAADIFDGKVN